MSVVNFPPCHAICVQLAEMVNLHFLSLMEALQECNSSVLAKVGWCWLTSLTALEYMALIA